MLVATCGSDPTVVGQTPVGTSYGYFEAMNGGNLTTAGFLTPDSTVEADVGLPFDEFQNVDCWLVSETSTEAVVSCSLTVREDWSGVEAGPCGWELDLRRRPQGPWLIYDGGPGGG